MAVTKTPVAKIAKQYAHMAYYSMAITISLQAEWLCMERTVPRVAPFLEPTETALREDFFLAILDVMADDTQRR